VVQPLHGITSKTQLYRSIYRFTGPLLSLLRRVAPATVTTTEELGRAMVSVTADGYPQQILEPRDITAAGRRDRPAG
jgi:hypothetical protein